MLTFEESEHIYRWNGAVVPSVTQILSTWVKPHGRGIYVNTCTGAVVEADVFEAAQDTGRAIHKAAEYILTGQGLDWDAIDRVLIPPLKELEKWVDDYQVKPLHVETPMYSVKHRVAGTPDLIGEMWGFNRLCLVDIKTGINNPTSGPQTAAYELIYREQGNYRKPIIRQELILPKYGGQYKFTQLDNGLDGAYFLAKLFQYNFRGGR